jgi:hypothetical protein
MLNRAEAAILFDGGVGSGLRLSRANRPIDSTAAIV